MLFIVCVSGLSKSKIPQRTCINPSTTPEPALDKLERIYTAEDRMQYQATREIEEDIHLRIDYR